MHFLDEQFARNERHAGKGEVPARVMMTASKQGARSGFGWP
jgi:hypothetical protein